MSLRLSITRKGDLICGYHTVRDTPFHKGFLNRLHRAASQHPGRYSGHFLGRKLGRAKSLIRLYAVHMTRRRNLEIGQITASDLDEAAASYPDDRRSDLFVWMSLNRVDFAERVLRRERTWAAWARAFEGKGLLSNSNGTVTGQTVRRTWYAVRKTFGLPIGDAPVRAELAKIQARRKPRTRAVPSTAPEPRSGEVAFGVRLSSQTPIVTAPPEPAVRPAVEMDDLAASLNAGREWLPKNRS
jgi:hypothetical protein